MVEIQVKRGESIESALRRFQALCDREGIPEEIKRSLRFDKETTRKKSTHKRKLSKSRRIQKDEF